MILLYLFCRQTLGLQCDFISRFHGKAVEGSFFSTEGTEFVIYEPKPFCNCWYSHKFWRLSPRNELGVSIQLPKIAWASGPWPCGSHSDVRIFRKGLKKNLRVDEFVIADNCYTDKRCTQTPESHHPSHKILGLIRARHEILKKGLKQFRILKLRFGHGISLHDYCFFAVLHNTELILDDEPPFHIQIE